jgi:quinolinate synthase
MVTTVQPDDWLQPQDMARLQEEVRALADERQAIILAHNYQLPEIQDVADFVGDSLALSRKAADSDRELIGFCGVHFMAETASVLCPQKTVLLPDLGAGCSLAETITAEELRTWKAEHPGAIVVMYVNTSAEVKAETDYCCISSNAVQVVEHIWREHGEDTEILFGPDMWLGAFVERTTGRRMRVWSGECHVHAGIRPQDIEQIRAEHPGAVFLIHPECGCTTSVMEVLASGDLAAAHCHMLSTGGMLDYARKSDAQEFIVATETGMLHPLQTEPDQALHPDQPYGGMQVHEDDHAAQAARRAGRAQARGARGGRGRQAGATADRAHGDDPLERAQARCSR